MEPWHHELGESHRDTCWEDNFTGSILSHLLVLQEMTGCPPGSAQQGSLAQTGMALPSSPEGWTLLIHQRAEESPAASGGILSLVWGVLYPQPCRLCLSWALPCNTPRPPTFTETCVQLCLQPSRLWMFEGLRSPTVRTLLQASGSLQNRILRVMCFLCSHATS